MTNDIQYFPNAKWVSLNGAFTINELKEVIKEIEKRSK